MRRLSVLLLLACLAAAAEQVALADLDLAAADGRQPAAAQALSCDGGTWTGDGLFLPAAAIARIPREFPLRGDRFTTPRPPYRADLALPADAGRALSITVVVCLATTGGDQDNLFSLGPRSRWLSGQVGRSGHIIAGLDNRWVVLTADALPPVNDRRWHAITIANSGDRSLRVAMDGSVVDLQPARERADFPPRAIPDDPPLLSFADPGSARHLHGLVRRIIVHRGVLSAEAITALHRQLAPAALPPPTAPAFVGAQRPGPPQEGDDGPPVAEPNNF